MLDDSIYIGYVAKVHGFNGSFSIKLYGTSEFCELCSKLTKIHTYSPNNFYSIKKINLNSKIYLKVELNELSKREEAKKLLQNKIYIKKGHLPKIDVLIKKQNQLIGYNVIDLDTSIGVIESIDYNRVQPLLIIKQNNKRFMAPYVENFIIDIKENKKELIVKFPEGLIEACKIE